MCGKFRPKKPKAAPPPPMVAVKEDVTPVTDVQFTAPVASGKKRRPQGKSVMSNALRMVEARGGLSF